NFGLSYDKRKALSDEQGYDIFRLYQSVFFDTRDNIFDPDFGSFLRFEIYEAGFGYLGNYDYIKWVSDISLYQRFFLSEWKWALRLYFGGISPYIRSDTLPIIDLFTVGGEGQVRGYDRFSIGPDLKRCYSYICKAGRYPLLFNYEIRRKINDYWGFVLFFDYGYLDGDKGYSGGMGIRYFTPIGPIRFDWAIKLKERSPTDRGKIYISLGHMF
ncbi:MAG: BamA/TamA family outer membrane protein, partial [candidate division WOR-3 bacterium]